MSGSGDYQGVFKPVSCDSTFSQEPQRDNFVWIEDCVSICNVLSISAAVSGNSGQPHSKQT